MFVDGDLLSAYSAPRSSTSFNGAVDVRRRRPGGTELSHVRALACFNGAVDVRRRRRSRGSRATRRRARFNGAVDVRRRRRSSPRAPPATPRRGFNGAVDVRRRRLCPRRCRRPRTSMLQWGRRCSSTETGCYDGDRQGSCGASMGPSMFVDGDLRTSAVFPVVMSSFNGAVDVRRRRPCTAGVVQLIKQMLQWGRRCSSTETAATLTEPELEFALQWGRRCSSTETGVD